MTDHFDLSHFAVTDPKVLAPNADLDKIRYSDLNYSSRIAALLAATRDKGMGITNNDFFNELLNGHLSLAAVIHRTRPDQLATIL